MLHEHESWPSASLPHRERVLQAAYELFDIGLNVAPQRFGEKSGIIWKQLQNTRLQRFLFPDLFAGMCNIAVVCGRSSRNLCVLNCEDEFTLNLNLDQFRKRGWPVWGYRTAKGGHLWFLSANGEVESIALGTIPGVEVRGSGGYVLCPPSVHPDGIVYQWDWQEGAEPPTLDIVKIDWLRALDRTPVLLQVRARRRDRQLPRFTQDYIAGNVPTEGRPDDCLFQAACDCASIQMPAGQARAKLTPTAWKQGLVQWQIDKTIRNAYSKFREPARKSDGDDIPPRPWELALVYSKQRDWKGRTGTTDHQLLLALIARAKLDSREDGSFRASQRELAELAHLGSLNTVRRSLARLLAEPFPLIEYAGKDRRSEACLYRFTEPMLAIGRQALRLENQGMDTLYSHPQKLSSGAIPQHSDLRERKALGHNGALLYQFMLQQLWPVTCKQIESALPMRYSKVTTAMRKLCDLGLAVSHGKRKGYSAVRKHAAELQRIAESSGATRRAQRRKEQHQKDRSIHISELIIEDRRKRDPHYPLERQKVSLWQCNRCKVQLEMLPIHLASAGCRCRGVKPQWQIRTQPKEQQGAKTKRAG